MLSARVTGQITAQIAVRLVFSIVLGLVFSFLLFLLPRAAGATELRPSEVFTDTSQVTDIELAPDRVFVATWGGVLEFDRKSRRFLRSYTHRDGLDSLHIDSLELLPRSPLVAFTETSRCALLGSRFVCKKHSLPLPQKDELSVEFFGKFRKTVDKSWGPDRSWGTAGGGAFFQGEHLDSPSLPGPHVTALSSLGDELFIGTFNHGLARLSRDGQLHRLPGPHALINALVRGKKHLFVGTNQGLFRTLDGEQLEKVELVEQGVVGLAYDGTSVWAATPGALYRIRDGAGPRSDVWWMPGGSRSLQKVSATQTHLWLGTEDRGALRVELSPTLVARDRPFSVFDRLSGLPSSWSLSVAARSGGGALMTSLRSGLVRIDPTGNATALSVPDVSPWGLSSLAESSGVWVGTQGGAAFVPDGAERPITIKGLPHPCVHVFFRDDRPELSDLLWVGTEGGLAAVSTSELELFG